MSNVKLGREDDPQVDTPTNLDSMSNKEVTGVKRPNSFSYSEGEENHLDDAEFARWHNENELSDLNVFPRYSTIGVNSYQNPLERRSFVQFNNTPRNGAITGLQPDGKLERPPASPRASISQLFGYPSAYGSFSFSQDLSRPSFQFDPANLHTDSRGSISSLLPRTSFDVPFLNPGETKYFPGSDRASTSFLDTYGTMEPGKDIKAKRMRTERESNPSVSENYASTNSTLH